MQPSALEFMSTCQNDAYDLRSRPQGAFYFLQHDVFRRKWNISMCAFSGRERKSEMKFGECMNIYFPAGKNSSGRNDT